MDRDNIITPHLIRWTPGVREMDTYFQDPIPENLDRLIQYFQKQEGQNNLAVKLLSVTLPLFLNLERLVPNQLLGDRARQDPKILRVALFGFCGETTNRWSGELIGLFGSPARLQELLLHAMDDRGEIRPGLMTWDAEGPSLDSYLESPSKENLNRLLYYITEHHQVFLKLFSVSFSHLVGIQDQVFSMAAGQLPAQNVKQVRKCLFVLSAGMSNRWATEYEGLCTNPISIYEGLRSLLEQVLPTHS